MNDNNDRNYFDDIIKWFFIWGIFGLIFKALFFVIKLIFYAIVESIYFIVIVIKNGLTKREKSKKKTKSVSSQNQKIPKVNKKVNHSLKKQPKSKDKGTHFLHIKKLKYAIMNFFYGKSVQIFIICVVIIAVTLFICIKFGYDQIIIDGCKKAAEGIKNNFKKLEELVL